MILMHKERDWFGWFLSICSFYTVFKIYCSAEIITIDINKSHLSWTLHAVYSYYLQVVDFCCGSNDFSLLLKEMLEASGKNCFYKNYDLIQPKVVYLLNFHWLSFVCLSVSLIFSKQAVNHLFWCLTLIKYRLEMVSIGTWCLLLLPFNSCSVKMM